MSFTSLFRIIHQTRDYELLISHFIVHEDTNTLSTVFTSVVCLSSSLSLSLPVSISSSSPIFWIFFCCTLPRIIIPVTHPNIKISFKPNLMLSSSLSTFPHHWTNLHQTPQPTHTHTHGGTHPSELYMSTSINPKTHTIKLHQLYNLWPTVGRFSPVIPDLPLEGFFLRTTCHSAMHEQRHAATKTQHFLQPAWWAVCLMPTCCQMACVPAPVILNGTTTPIQTHFDEWMLKWHWPSGQKPAKLNVAPINKQKLGWQQVLGADCVYSVPVLSDNGKIVYMSECTWVREGLVLKKQDPQLS